MLVPPCPRGTAQEGQGQRSLLHTWTQIQILPLGVLQPRGGGGGAFPSSPPQRRVQPAGGKRVG